MNNLTGDLLLFVYTDTAYTLQTEKINKMRKYFDSFLPVGRMLVPSLAELDPEPAVFVIMDWKKLFLASETFPVDVTTTTTSLFSLLKDPFLATWFWYFFCMSAVRLLSDLPRDLVGLSSSVERRETWPAGTTAVVSSWPSELSSPSQPGISD